MLFLPKINLWVKKMDDYLEFEKESKTIKSINLDSFSISELREYLIQLDNEILRVKGEIDKKSKTKSQAEDYFNRK